MPPDSDVAHSQTVRPPLALLLAVALLSAAVLGFEVALTRVFAVLLRYHFAFLVVSIALCGLGVGGYAAHWLRRRRELPLPLLAALFGITIDAALLAMLRGVFAHFPEAYWVAALLVLVPFALAGAFLAEVFARYPAWSGRLYAWDLAGAALAAAGVVGLLQIMGAIDACLAVAALAALAGLCVTPIGKGGGLAVTAGGLALLCMVNQKARLLDIPPLPPKFDAQQNSLADKGMTQPLFTELATPGHTSRIIDTRWNAFARTDVVEDTADPDSYLIYSNGNVPTNMMRWDGNLKSIGRLTAGFGLSDWAFAAAPLGKGGTRRGDVLSIGPGGGLDALLALRHGAARFDGAEINPSIVGLMHEPKYRAWNGGIYEQPGVRVVTAEGRAFVRETAARGQRYDLIFSALTKTATAGQGMALLESFIYTQDAFEDYYRSLSPNGQLTIVGDNPLLLARFTMTALAVLWAHGVQESEGMRHLALAYDPRPGPYQFALVLQKSPFSREQTETLLRGAEVRHLTPIWIPDQAALADFGPYEAVADGKLSRGEFVTFMRDASLRDSGVALDISPRPDDSPFVLDLSVTTLPVFKQLAWLAALLGLVLVALGWGDVRREKTTALEADALYVGYFLALGIGFLLVEIPLSQKLILPLGYPTLALTTILFSILLGGGLGSWASQRWDGAALRRWAIGCALGVTLATAVVARLLDWLPGVMLLMPLPTRCALAALLLLPLGFLLGTPFPSGMRLFAHRRAAQVPLIWGLNGVASVVGSLCAAMGAKAWGFHDVLLVGAAIYALAALLLLAAGRLETPELAGLTPSSNQSPEEAS